MTKEEFKEALFECVGELQAVDGYVMRKLPRSEWVVRMCGDDAIQVRAWVHLGGLYSRKIMLADLPKYIFSLNDPHLIKN